MGYRIAADRYEDEEPGSNFFVRHWRGQLSLPASWFLVSGILSTVLVSLLVAGVLMVERGASSLSAIAAAWLSFFLAFLLLRIWALVGTWRSAGRHEARGGSAAWANIARALLVLGVVASLAQTKAYGQQAWEYGQLAIGRDSLGPPAELVQTGEKVLIRGAFTVGTAEKFEQLVDASPNLKRVDLESVGGRIWEAQRIAAIVKRRALETHVDRRCESACTFVLLAGRQRWISPDAQVGFHQPSLPGFTAEQQQAAITANAKDYVEAGIAPSFVEQINATPPESMWYPTHEELVAGGVTDGTEIVVQAGGKRDRVAEKVLATAAELNRAGRTKIDDVTYRVGAVSLKRELTIKHLITAEVSASQARQIGRQLKPELIAAFCGDAPARALIADGAKIVLDYKNTAGRTLFTVPIAACG